MTDKELHKLSRRELLEMLLKQSKKMDRLQARVQELEEALNNREIEIEKAGSIAEAALRLNGVFEAAQRAADQYLENVRLRGGDAEEQRKQSAAQAMEESAETLSNGEGREPTGGDRQ